MIFGGKGNNKHFKNYKSVTSEDTETGNIPMIIIILLKLHWLNCQVLM